MICSLRFENGIKTALSAEPFYCLNRSKSRVRSKNLDRSSYEDVMSRRSHTPRITGGAWKGRPLIGGVPQGVRPTSSKIREALGSKLSSHFPGAYVLDAFAGAGVFSAEALSRGATNIVAIDKNMNAIRSIRASISNLDPEVDITLKCGDTLSFLRRARSGDTHPFDIVFIDPPYASDLILPALKLLVSGNWVHKDSAIVVEASSRDEPTPAPCGLAILNSRRYGDTQISMYCLSQSEGEES